FFREFNEFLEVVAKPVCATDTVSFMLECGAADIPALAALTDLKADRRFGIIKEKFAKSVITFFTGHLADWPPRNAGLVKVNQQIGDTVMFGRIGFCADEHEHMRRLHTLRGPDFLTVDDPFATIFRQLALGPHTGEVGAGAWFGISLPPDIFALDRFTNEQVFLFLSALFEQCRHRHVHAVTAHLHRRANAGEFFADDLCLYYIYRLL